MFVFAVRSTRKLSDPNECFALAAIFVPCGNHGDDGTTLWRWDWSASGRVGADIAAAAAAPRQRSPARLCYASTRDKSLTRPASILHFTCYERTPPAAPCASRKSRLQAPRRGAAPPRAQSWGAEERSSSAYAGRAGFHLEDYHCPERAHAAHARCWRAGVKGRSHDGAGLVYGISKWRRADVPPLS